MNLRNPVLISAVAAAFAATLALPSQAAAPMAKIAAPGFYRVMLGDFEVTAISDGTVDLPMSKLLKEAPEKTVAALKKSYLNDPTTTSDNAFLINTGSKLILIDTGAGALFGPTLGKLLANLKASGYQPEQVDDVFITHMHPDHVGGLVSNGVAVFPNAVVHADKRDADFWLSQAQMAKAPKESQGFFQGAMASLNPYVAAGKFQAFEHNGEIVPGVTSYASYGHTAGHTSYIVESKGQKLLVLGDLIHVASVQFDSPNVAIGFDSDTKAAIASRQKVFAMADKQGDLVAVAHLQFPGLGHVRSAGKSWQWIPANYTQLP
jgi:glyoxylase-like metal-dependent hydrolase (beta-lactamase superfamily II)